jgi:hypothetical protein
MHRIAPLLRLLVAACVLACTHGAVVSWISPCSGAWETGANWNTGAPPSPQDTALINTTSATCNNVTGSVIITVNQPLQLFVLDLVSGQLNVASGVAVSADTIKVHTAGGSSLPPLTTIGCAAPMKCTLSVSTLALQMPADIAFAGYLSLFPPFGPRLPLTPVLMRSACK